MIILEEDDSSLSGRINYSSSPPTQAKRRRSSGTKRRSHTTMLQEDMQSFLFNNNNNKQTELDPESSTASCTSTPNSFTNPPVNFNDQTSYENNNFMMNNSNTHPDELTDLLNDVLNEREQQEDYNYSTATNQMSVDMTRSPTTNSFSSSSSTTAFIVSLPQQQQTVQPIVCGSFTSHSNCSPAIDTQGESVVITITPLSTLFTSDEERLYKNSQGKPVTRIVTCYCGNSCICPGCFVHPNNYLLQQQQQLTMQQLLQQHSMQQQNSSTSSSYSSDDEDLHMNYTATNYPLL